MSQKPISDGTDAIAALFGLAERMESDTPRTDEEIKRITSMFDGDYDDIYYGMDQLGKHARQLERELTTMRKENTKTDINEVDINEANINNQSFRERKLD